MIDKYNQTLEQIGDSHYYIVRDDGTGDRVGFYYADDNEVAELENLDPDNTSRNVKYIDALDAIYIGGKEGGLLSKGGVLHRSDGKYFCPVESYRQTDSAYDPTPIDYPPGVAAFFVGSGSNMEALIFRKLEDGGYKKANLWHTYQDEVTLKDMLIKLFKGVNIKKDWVDRWVERGSAKPGKSRGKR